MATRDYSITGPDGRTLSISGPVNATPEQLRAAAEKAFAMAPADQSFPQKLGRQVLNTAAGAVRGAGSIGATILAPVDIAKDAIAGKGLSLESNRERRQAMTEALGTLGAETDSLAFQAGKIGGEVAGTLGVGGTIANAAGRVLPAGAAPVVEAIRTAGMSGGNMAARTAGGAITGGASAALVNPEDAGTGALIGGALPGAIRAAGAAGQAIGGVVRGPQQTPEMTQAIQAARGQGYVIPPTQARPNLLNRTLEGFSGKLTTAQNASARNQGVTNALAADTIGVPRNVPITIDVLNDVRRNAGAAYQAVNGAGVITPGPAYAQALDRIVAPYQTAVQGFPNAQPSPVINAINALRSPQFDSSAAVAQLGAIREAADTAVAQGNRGVGRSLRAGANALEDAIEAHLQTTGNAQLLNAFRNARQTIARTYTVQKALNATTGTIDARKLVTDLNKGRPMTGPLREAAEFAARFPTAAQATERMGSLPQLSPLDFALGIGTSGVSGNPLMLASILGRPATRALSLSDLVQNRLAQQPAGAAGAGVLGNQTLQQLLYRGAPVAGSGQ
jgi:hypothetical protein